MMITLFFSTSAFAAAGDPVGVTYSGHVQNIGWQAPVSNGDKAGTTGQSLQMEAIKINLDNAPAGANIVYAAQTAYVGWNAPVQNGAPAGSVGESRRLEALTISLENMPGYSVQYRAHVQNIGWQDWVSDGDVAGTVDQSLQMEAIEIKIVQTTDLTAYDDALKAVTKADYTTESWDAYQAALIANVVTVANTQAEVDAATAAITAAQADLVKVTNITAVTAINPTTVTVTFNTAVTALDKSALTVTNEAGNKQYVKSVELANDGLSAAVTFFSPFVDKTTYDMSIAFPTNTATGSFDYVQGEAASIVIADQKIVTGKTIAYQVYDANGLDITSLVTVGIETNIAGFFATPVVKGSVTLEETTGSAFAIFTVTNSDATVISSRQATITVDNTTATTLGSYWTINDTGDVLTKATYGATGYVQNTKVSLTSSAKIAVSVIDQFGDDYTLSAGYSLKYASLNTDVAVVDTANGTITPRKAGNAAVRVTLLNGTTTVLTQDFEFTVTEAAKLAGIAVEKTDVAVTDATLNIDAGDATYDVKGLDQFNNNFALTDLTGTALTNAAVSSDIAVVTAAYANPIGSAITGTLILTPNAVGTATVTVKYGAFTKVINVTVNQMGDLVSYNLEGFKNILTTRDDAATTAVNETTMTVGVKGIDANGVKDVNNTEATFTVTDKNAVVTTVTPEADDSAIITSTGKTAGDTYTLTVKVGTLTVATQTFTVIENGTAPTYTIKSNQVTLDGTQTTIEEAIQEQVLVFDGTATVTVTDATYSSDNAAVLAADGTIGNDGKATIYVDKITVNVVTDPVNALTNGTFTLDLKGEALNVTVTKTATELAATELAAAKASVPADLTVYTDATALAVTNAVALPEITTLNKTDKTAAINTAVAALVDISTLAADITTAQALNDSAVEGIVSGNYAAGSIATFQTAIDNADLVLADTNATQAAVDQAISDLVTATTTFESGIVA